MHSSATLRAVSPVASSAAPLCQRRGVSAHGCREPVQVRLHGQSHSRALRRALPCVESLARGTDTASPPPLLSQSSRRQAQLSSRLRVAALIASPGRVPRHARLCRAGLQATTVVRHSSSEASGPACRLQPVPD